MTQIDSITASAGIPTAWPVFGMFTGASKGSPVSMAWIIGEGSSPDCHVCRSLVPGQPGVDVGDVLRLVLLAPRNRAELNVVGRPPLGLGREGERDELGNVAVAGRREGAPALEQRQLEEVPLGEVELGELVGLGAPGVRGQGGQAADLVDQAAQRVEAVGAVDLERGQHREVVDAGHRGRDRLEGPAQWRWPGPCRSCPPRGRGRPS